MASAATALLLLFLLVPAAVLAVVAVLVARSGRSAADGAAVPVRDAPAAYRRALGHARATAWVSWLLLVAAVVAVAVVAAQIPGGLPPGAAYAVPLAVAGLVFLAACAVGELTWPHPAGSVRRAPLQVRTATTVAPGWLRRLVWGWAALLVGTLLVTGLTGGTGGLELAVGHPDDVVSVATPYPGWRYGATLAVAAVLVVGACEAVLRLVARRPAVADTAAEDDQRLRRVSAGRLLAGVQLVLAVAATAVLAIASNAARSVGTSWAARAALSAAPPVPAHPGAATLAVVAAAFAAATIVGGVVVAVIALSRAAAEAAQPLAPPPAAAGGPMPAGAPS